MAATVSTTASMPAAKKSSATESTTPKTIEADHAQKPNTATLSNEVATTDDAYWVIAELKGADLRYVDQRSKHGALWVLGRKTIKQRLKPLIDAGAHFTFKPAGGKATKHNPTWWLNGYPEKKEALVKEIPLITQEQIHLIDLGDEVFHKAFGYGEVVDFGNDSIFISIDGKVREFVFPGTFYQGTLQLV